LNFHGGNDSQFVERIPVVQERVPEEAQSSKLIGFCLIIVLSCIMGATVFSDVNVFKSNFMYLRENLKHGTSKKKFYFS